MGLIINSQIAAIRYTSEGKKKSATLHFIAVDPDGNRRMDVVHPNKGFDPSQYHVGQDVEIHVAPFYNKKSKQIEFAMIDDSDEHQFAVTNGSGISAGMSRQ